MFWEGNQFIPPGMWNSSMIGGNVFPFSLIILGFFWLNCWIITERLDHPSIHYLYRSFSFRVTHLLEPILAVSWRKARVYCGQVKCKQLTLIPTGRFRLCEEAEVPGENPHKDSEHTNVTNLTQNRNMVRGDVVAGWCGGNINVYKSTHTLPPTFEVESIKQNLQSIWFWFSSGV